MRTIHPRLEFLQSPAGTAFAETISNNPDLIAGIRAALLEFSISQPPGRTWEDAARSHHCVQGAKDFAQYLLDFINSEPAAPQPTDANLKWPTKQSLQAQRPPPRGSR